MQNKSKSWKNQFEVSVCFLLLLVFFHLPGFSTSSVNWNRISQNDIFIYFTESDASNARTVQAFLNETLPELTRILTYNSPIRIEIYICPTRETFKKFTGGRMPEWSEAVSISNRNQIILKSPNWSRSRRSFRATVLHELTHLILAQRVAYHPIPTWLNEGLAVYFSGERSLTSISLISKAQTTQSLIPLDKIQNVLRFQRNKALLAYQQSYYAVQFLLQQFGTESLQPLLDAIKNNFTFEQAFQQTYQIEFTDFERQWREHIRQKNRWDFMLDLGNFLWILLGLLFLIAVISVFFRKRQKIREWESEENE